MLISQEPHISAPFLRPSRYSAAPTLKHIDQQMTPQHPFFLRYFFYNTYYLPSNPIIYFYILRCCKTKGLCVQRVCFLILPAVCRGCLFPEGPLASQLVSVSAVLSARDSVCMPFGPDPRRSSLICHPVPGRVNRRIIIHCFDALTSLARTPIPHPLGSN